MEPGGNATEIGVPTRTARPTRLLSYLGDLMPFWDYDLDLVVLTRPQPDVMTGLLPVLERYEVGGVLAPEVNCHTSLCRRWEERMEAIASPQWPAQAGLRVWLDEGLLLTVLYPPPTRGADGPLLLRLDYGQVCFLLPGEMREEDEAWLVENGAWLECTVLRAAGHGDAGATSEPFLETVAPQVVVISVGEDNLAHHPQRALLDRLTGRRVYRTDRDGTVEVVSDGVTYRVHTER